MIIYRYEVENFERRKDLKVHEKLKHLTEEEINEVVDLYQNKEVKVKDIISKYKIDVKPTGLVKILPPVKVDRLCPYCHQNMYYNLEARGSYSYSVDSNIKFCLSCGHKEYPERWGDKEECNCGNCQEMKEKKRQEKQNMIYELYQKEYEKVQFSSLTLEDKVILIYILMNNPNHNTETIAPCRSSKEWIRKLNRLLEMKIISLSPRTDVEAFTEEEFPNRYYVAKATYDINVIFDDDEILQINNRKYFIQEHEEVELLDLLKKYIYDDAIESFSDMLEQRRLSLYKAEEAKNKFIQLLDEISYTQILYLCERVAKFFSDRVLTGDMSRSLARNAALINVSKFYERAIESEWLINHYDYEKAGEELRFYVEQILGKPLSILKEVANVENFKNWPDIGNTYEQETRESE